MTVARAGEAFAQYDASLSSFAAINTSADVALARITRGIYLGASGNVVVIGAGDSASVTLTGMAAGVWHPMQIQTIISSGTTATGIVVGY